jgi:hypothetical protein
MESRDMKSIQELIDKHHENKKEPPRPHIGASLIGHPCDRWVWLSFRWAVQPQFPGRILRLLRRGQMEEATIVDDLRAIGMDVRTSRKQERVDFGAHVSGSIDAIIESGVPESPKNRHIAEFKTHNLKSFNDLEKNGVNKSKPEHFVQMQIYMHGTKIDQALYVAVCKDDDRIYTERVLYNKELAEKFIARGRRLALEDRMPPPISTDPSWYQCKLCDAYEFCHETKTTKHVNCRTCAHSTANVDSTWSCERHEDDCDRDEDDLDLFELFEIPVEVQRHGCESHVLHPDLVPWELKDGPDEWTAVYVINGKDVANGDPEIDGVFSSRELLANAAACADKGWTQLHDMRKQFCGRFVG